MSRSHEFCFPARSLPHVDVDASSGLRFLVRDGVRIAHDFEPPLNPTRAPQLLVLINGFARPRADFRAFRKRIHAQMGHLATLALDNRGAGESEGGLDNLSVQSMALDAAFVAQAYASAMHLDGVHALGISMGGMIAQTWAAHDERIQSLVLVSTTAGGSARTWPEGVNPDEARRKPFEGWPADFEHMQRKMVRYFGPRFRKNSPLLIEMMVRNMMKSHTTGEAQGRAKAQYDATIGYDGTQLLTQIRCPTLVLSGTDDDVIPMKNSSDICGLIPHAELHTFAEAGHLLLIEEPENFVAQVRSFLEAAQTGRG